MLQRHYCLITLPPLSCVHTLAVIIFCNTRAQHNGVILIIFKQEARLLIRRPRTPSIQILTNAKTQRSKRSVHFTGHQTRTLQREAGTSSALPIIYIVHINLLLESSDTMGNLGHWHTGLENNEATSRYYWFINFISFIFNISYSKMLALDYTSTFPSPLWVNCSSCFLISQHSCREKEVDHYLGLQNKGFLANSRQHETRSSRVDVTEKKAIAIATGSFLVITTIQIL